MQIADGLAIFLAEKLIFFTVLVIPYLWSKRETHDLLRIAVSVVVAFTASELIKYWTAVPRPFVAGDFEPLVAVSARDLYGSFPSGHATFMAALAAAVFFKERIPGLIIFGLGILVGLGRVLVGIHYPLDIVGGFALGIAVSTFFKYVHDKSPIW